MQSLGGMISQSFSKRIQNDRRPVRGSSRNRLNVAMEVSGYWSHVSPWCLRVADGPEQMVLLQELRSAVVYRCWDKRFTIFRWMAANQRLPPFVSFPDLRWWPRLAQSHVHRSWATSNSVSTWMGDRHGRPSAVNLCPFVGVDLNLYPTVYIAVIVLSRT